MHDDFNQRVRYQLSKGHDSGRGSNVDCTSDYRNILEQFIRLNAVRSVVDVGCGDWQFSHLIPWESYGVAYLGLDISEFIVERNNRNYGTKRCRFEVMGHFSELANRGPFDLVICKDALQHMPIATINGFLDMFELVGHRSLVTNDVLPFENLNGEIELGGYRAVDIRRPPFSRKASVIAEYAVVQEQNVFVKQVQVIHGQSAP